ncbi:MAG: TonB-dependent receptor [Bacteroidota bacterium]
MRLFLSFFFPLFFPILTAAQADSIVLNADQFIIADIQPSERAETRQQVYAPTRSEKNIEELPYTVYVITKREIRENGYRTLVDALKMQPGIRTSQPGSALEGETFLMRGLLGNSYAKILLNGNPIRPSVVRGMPIGAQLPIQQAERIEIIYGPMVMYGADVSAGIINIVLDETERPVFTQANLALGSNEYTNLDISFGGRLGKSKNTIRYSLFGSYTFRGDLRIRHDNDTLFTPESYNAGNFNFADVSPNFVSINNTDQIFNDLPHQSRMVGINLGYRFMKLTFEAMYRRDHSSIGLNPLAVSYSNPLNYIGERIINGNFSINKDYKWLGFEVRVGYLQYQMDNRSSYRYIYNTSAQILDNLSFLESIDPNTLLLDAMQYDSLNKAHQMKYFDGSRFSFSESFDFRSDLILKFFPTTNLEIKLGCTYAPYQNTPLVTYSKVPLASSFRNFFFNDPSVPVNLDLVPIIPESFNGTNFNAFGQIYWTPRKWTVALSGQWWSYTENAFYFQYDQRIIRDRATDFSANIGINYRLSNEWSFRANFGDAIRMPSTYYRGTTVDVSLRNDDPIELSSVRLTPERTQNYEAGIRWSPNKKNFFDIATFRMESSLIRYRTIDSTAALGYPLRAHGFYNSDIVAPIWRGIQVSYINRSTYLDFSWNLSMAYKNDDESFVINSAETTELSEMPRSIRKTRVVIRPTKEISLTFDTVRMGRALNRIRGRGELPRYRIYDVMGNYYVNRNFRMFFKIRNLFNREFAGLNATSTPDDLFYNPQEKRIYRIGMSYSID